MTEPALTYLTIRMKVLPACSVILRHTDATQKKKSQFKKKEKKRKIK